MIAPRLMLGLATLAVALPAAAQSFDASGPRRPLMLPPELATAAPRTATAGPVAASSETAGPLLRPFPALRDGPVVRGMSGTLAWPVALTAAQAGREVSLTLAPVSSLAVRPDTSSAAIAVNGTVVGRLRLGLPDTPVTLRVPAALLRPGMNTVSVSVRQQHRVDCSPQATFELSTAFDTTTSGLAVAPLRPSTLADLAAATPRADGALLVSVVADRALAPENVPLVASAVQALALVTGTLHPVVEIVPDAVAATGIVLALGAQGTLARVLPEDALRRGPLAVVPGADGGAPLLVVTGETPDAIAGALAPLLDLADRMKASAAPSPSRIELVQNEAMAALAGPRSGLVADIVLPADAFPADYGQATAKVRGTLSPDVLAAARLVVGVNGRPAATTTLARGRWGQADQATVSLPFGLLRPGRNRIDIAAELPVEGDAACDPQRPVDTTRLQLAPETVIELSEPARAIRMPDLMAVSAGGWPHAGTAPLVLHVPRPDRGSMAAALTLAARLAIAAGRVRETRFAVEPPRLPDGPVLTIGPAGALPPEALAAAGLDRGRLVAGWGTPPGRRRGEEACDVAGGDETASGPTASVALPGRPRATAGQDPVGWITGLARRGTDRFRPGRGLDDGGTGLAASADLVMAQAGSGNVLVTARDSATLAHAVDCLARPRTWDRLAGQATGLDLASGAVTVVRAASVSLWPTDWSPGNLRRLLAGWLSLNALAYVAVSLFAAAALGAGTAGIVRRAGRSQS